MAHWQANLQGFASLINRRLLPGMAPAATQRTRSGCFSASPASYLPT